MRFQSAFTAPHYRAAETGQAILEAGGTASEAMVAAAAMSCALYPHMNSIGGDGFWLISKAEEAPIGIDACGAAALQIDAEAYCHPGAQLAESGGEASLTMAGTVSGWQKALEIDGGGLGLQDLLAPAISAVEQGVEATHSLAQASRKTFTRLGSLQPFANTFLKQGCALQAGDIVSNAPLARTLRQLADRGLKDFYTGEIAAQAAKELAWAGSPLRLEDFHAHRAKLSRPLHLTISRGHLYNLAAPTQGLASLLILGIYDQLSERASSESEHIHLLVEATKQSFIVREQVICDESKLQKPLQAYLDSKCITKLASAISMERAKNWQALERPGDTVWMGAIDRYGTMVSFIQSIYWEFGSGLVLPGSGILWNIRSLGFSLDKAHHNALAPGKKPFHTLNPAYAQLNDGRRIVYGSMGGDGQPQTQACIFSRYVYQGASLPEAVARARWLLGRTWGEPGSSLRLEEELYQQCASKLSRLGHDLYPVADRNELMGHAGAIVSNILGKAIAASDPRSDGCAIVEQEGFDERSTATV